MNHFEGITVRDHNSGTEMRSSYAAIRARFAEVRPPVPPPLEPEPAKPADLIQSESLRVTLNHGGPAPGVLDPALRLDNFVVHDGNLMAHAAMRQAVGGLARTTFNPIFVHAGAGLGKTHLLQGAVTMAQLAGARALYLSAEAFLYDLPQRQARLASDLSPYRLVAIDDLQHIAGKLAHAALRRAIDEVLVAGRQLVLAAAVAPADLEFDPGLHSRIEAGITVPIAAPDGEARAAILRSLIDTMVVHGHGAFAAAVGDDIIAAIAGVGPASGRHLGAVLTRLHADHLLRGLAPTVERALQAAAALIRPEEMRRIMIEDIQRAVAKHYMVRRNDLLSARRTAAVVRPRQVAMYLAKIMTLRSMPEIGRRFGGRDHTTVLHAVRKIGGLVDTDQELAGAIAAIRADLAEGQQQ